MTTYGVDRSGGSTGSATVPSVDSIHWNDVVFLDSTDSPYTVTNDDRGKLLAVDASGGAVTINLPAISALANFPDQTWLIGVKKTDGSANAVTINRNGTDTIDDVTAKNLTATDSGITLVPDTDTSPDQWVAMEWGPTGGNWTLDTFSGDGSDTTFTLSVDPGTENNTFVFIDGVYQAKSEYSISGTTLTFSTAPASGTNNVQVMIGTSLAIGVPGDNSVSTAKIVDDAVTIDKLNDNARGLFQSQQVFTANGTWTKPANLKFVRVTVVGGGGGSGGCATTAASQTAASGGGGGGGTSIKVIQAASLGSTEAVTVGAGGGGGSAGNNDGSAGGTSSFGTHLTATGGAAGNGGGVATALAAQVGAGGALGGIGATGDINIRGGSGTESTDFNDTVFQGRGGDGGESSMGGRTHASGASTQAAAKAGAQYGGGAAGCANGVSQTQQAGAAGAAGIVIVEEFF